MRLALGALEAIAKEFSVDPNRLYITGLSMGGYGTWDAITRTPQKWAAAVPICGGGDASRIASAKNVPVWAFHGINDQAVPVERTRELIATLKAAGSTPLYSEYPYVAHDSWTFAYGEPELLPWLFAQRRGQPPVAFATIAGELAQPPSSEFPGEGTVQSGLWFRPLWKTRRTEWASAKNAEQGAIVFFGDSITQGWSSLAKDFPKLKVANRGISGDTTRGLRFRLKGDVLDLRPKAVSILIGTNDLDQGTEPPVVVKNLKAIVAELRQANAALPIVINKVMPRGAKPSRFPEKIQQLNTLYEQAFANDPGITFCDTWSVFADNTGQCRKEEFPDMLHPNAAGYAKWTAALTPILEKLGVAN
jgi:lysophospholipase L1-like esterase